MGEKREVRNSSLTSMTESPKGEGPVANVSDVTYGASDGSRGEGGRHSGGNRGDSGGDCQLAPCLSADAGKKGKNAWVGEDVK